ncbi:MAG: DUF5682 family protein [Kibdelosporangium sp.]
MTATFVGVRHHSPACAKVVAATIRRLRPAYVLIEGPADMNDRLGDLLLGHTLPIAIYTSYRDNDRTHASWTPFCDYSPEWVAMTTARETGAEIRFIDLPAWHPQFEDRSNRYADAEQRYADVTGRLCRQFAVDNVDTLWDHLFEVEPDDGLPERLTVYFDLLRGEAQAGADDAAREQYMASWVRAAVADASGRPVVVVTGGFHTAAIRVLALRGDDQWPQVPALPEGATGASYLVPYSYRRLDSFTGYQSGMPSPGYYERVWKDGVEAAATALVASVAARLRRRGQPVSTADLIAARTQGQALALLRGHTYPARADVLDGLVSTLVSEDLTQPPPWTRRGPLVPGAHPAVVEMVAELSGDRVGRLDPGTPAPPLVADIAAELERHRLDHGGRVQLTLTAGEDLARSRVLHRLRVLGIPGFVRDSGFAGVTAAGADERWRLTLADERLPAMIEAAAYGMTLADAAGAALRERTLGADLAKIAKILFDATLCGLGTLPDDTVDKLAEGVTQAHDVGEIGSVLSDVLALWRHDRLFGIAHSAALGTVINAATMRVLWLVEGMRGGPAPADAKRLHALTATRDALRHAGSVLGQDRESALGVARRVGADTAAPPDLRGAMSGLAWALGDPVDPQAVRGMSSATMIGDWLAGLFTLARDEVLSSAGVVGVLDELVHALPESEFLIALPALRLAFTYFPPAERESIAEMVLARRGVRGSARALLQATVSPLLVAEAMALEATVEQVLVREGLA